MKKPLKLLLLVLSLVITSSQPRLNCSRRLTFLPCAILTTTAPLTHLTMCLPRSECLAHVCGFLVGGYRETRMKSGEEGCWAEYHRGTLVA